MERSGIEISQYLIRFLHSLSFGRNDKKCQNKCDTTLIFSKYKEKIFYFAKNGKDYQVRRLIWKLIYNFLAKRFGHITDWQFMNYGYVFHDDVNSNFNKLQLDPEDENDRYCIQMYHIAANVNDLTGLKVLEVGSGRGGGVHYVKKYLNPESIVGVDISKRAIQLCNNNNSLDGLSFIEGDAENLCFDNESFDLIINIESSMHYGSVDNFFSEVNRILKPGGIFSIADIRPKKRLPILEDRLKNLPE